MIKNKKMYIAFVLKGSYRILFSIIIIQCIQSRVAEESLCDGSPEQTHTCVNISITSFRPHLGPWEGETSITIEGFNLGTYYEDIYGGITVAGIPCEPFQHLYIPSLQIVCQVSGISSKKFREGPVIVKVNNFRVQSVEHYQFVDPKIEQLFPIYGPRSGGTLLTLSGRYMNAGSLIKVFVDDLPCRIVSKEPTQLKCKTSASGGNREGKIKVKFDQAIRTYKEALYAYTEDPNITNVNSGENYLNFAPRGILSGGIAINVTGTNLLSVQKPLFYVYDEKWTKRYFGSCEAHSDSRMVCKSPYFPDINSSSSLDADFSKRLDYGFIMDDVAGVQDMTVTEYGFPSSYLPFILFINPTFKYFAKNTRLNGRSNQLVIDGENIDQACQMTDIEVRVGDAECEVISLSRWNLTCLRPIFQSDTEDVSIHIGENFKQYIGRISPVQLLMPKIEDIYPRRGPRSGGTLLSLKGRYMNGSNSVAVFVDNLPCEVILVEETEVKCITSPSEKTRKGKVEMVSDQGTRRYNKDFYYTEDPSVESVESGARTIPAGGINITVFGKNLLSVQRPLFYIYNHDQTTRFFDSCEVLTNTKMVCSTPHLPDVDSSSLNANNSKYLKYGFEMDNTTSTQNLPIPMRKPHGFISLYPNPKFDNFPNGLKQQEDEFLIISGYDLDLVCRKEDIIVKIGGDSCTVTNLTSQTLNCTLPLSQSIVNTKESFIDGDIFLDEVTIQFGKIVHQSIGKLFKKKNSKPTSLMENPKIENVSPRQGPLSGGTLLTILGKHLDVDLTKVSVANLQCAIVSVKATEVNCTTSASSSLVNGKITLIYGGRSNSRTYHFDVDLFEYTANPKILCVESSSESLKSIPVGGIRIVVCGVDFFSIQEPRLHVYGKSRSEFYKSPCTVHSNSLMTCLCPSTPNIESSSLNGDSPKHLNYSFVMNNGNKTQKIHTNESYHKFDLYPNPKFNNFLEIVKLGPGDKLNVSGKDIDLACDETNLEVKIGNSYCNVTYLSRNYFLCLPDKSLFSRGNDVIEPVNVSVGRNFKQHVGKIRCSLDLQSYWLKEVLFYVALIVVLLIILILILKLVNCRSV